MPPEIKTWTFFAPSIVKTVTIKVPRSVAEMDPFYSDAREIWSEAEIEKILGHVAENPEDGDPVPGTGGLRKLRWAIPGTAKGKSGGARILFLPGGENMPAYMLAAFKKADQSDLTASQRNEARQVVEAIKARYSAKQQKEARRWKRKSLRS